MALSKVEALARALMAHYHPRVRPIFNYRPNWLRNPETGNNLEVDIFYPDLQAGIEIQGEQHGRPIDGLQKDFATFEKQQRHDMLKIQRCQEWGVKLYHLTVHDLTRLRFEAFLKRFEDENRLMPNRYISPALELFAEAERLARRKMVRNKYVDIDYGHTDSKPSLLQKVWGWLNS